ncbi:isochorismatase [Streptomyces daghestanicus]|uniref:Isochorismatase n=3 Tax=Streptomyces TaxID=1883 RepID=A0A918GUU2_STRGD|nr:isochorismatase [Streptomyces niveoruber]GGT25043.1 isochorismatase [Streptomyces griseoviridis]GGU59003.1 isochorismatase [Streptomyces daghestanicus]GHI30071.1 isochorismatase [Streptomyces daghestanicus]
MCRTALGSRTPAGSLERRLGGTLRRMSKTALVVIDMINTYDHPDADRLLPSARSVVPVLTDLLGRARAADALVIYVNDNFGEWRSHHGELLDKALAGPHADLVDPLRPDDSSLFVVKARHSIFFETPLTYLVHQLGIGELVLAGQVTEQCVLYSALDAHIRHLDVVVPKDAVAHIHQDLADAALRMMERNMGARVCDSAELWA